MRSCGGAEGSFQRLAAPLERRSPRLRSSAHPELARAIVAAGHQVGNHSYSHHRMIFLSPRTAGDEIDRTSTLIRRAGFDGEIVFRPPYGKKLVALPWALRQRKMTAVTWDVDPESFAESGSSSAAIARHVVDNVRPGSIVLLHPMGDRRIVRDALPLIISELRVRGYRFVLINQLLGRPAQEAR